MNAILALVISSALATVTPKDSLWYRAVDVRDLTGDGVLDSLILQATGTRVDSLSITFDIRSRGSRLYHETWLSTWYFQYDAPIDSIGEPAKRVQVFKHLREFFRSLSYGVLDTLGTGKPWRPSEDDRDPRGTIAFNLKYERAFDSLTHAHVNVDSAEARARNYAWSAPVDTQQILRAWRELARVRPTTFTFFSGGEYTRTIVWSAVVQKFVVVWSCC